MDSLPFGHNHSLPPAAFSLRDKARVRQWLKKSSRSTNSPLRGEKVRVYLVEHYQKLIRKGDYPSDAKLEQLADFFLDQGMFCRKSVAQKQPFSQ